MPISIHPRSVATSPKRIGQREQIAAEDVFASRLRAVAEAQGFPKAGHGESERIGNPKQKEA
jgi:hypothetical protein